ncbi:MAG: glycosyltransferase family 4 protein [Thermodesulfobacteriota bacterium]|nr:glycosyltransferase family 4 protein [Thermodesulfobacteriota bacterium]
MTILSPMATGNGAYVIHKILSERIRNYRLYGYNPYWTLLPPALSFFCRKHAALDLIHTTPDYAWFFKKAKTPLVITFHNYVLDSFMGPYSSFAQRVHYKTDLKFFIHKALAKADKITSVSRFTAELVKRDMGFKGEIQVIYNGIDCDLFCPQKQKPGKNVKVLFSGNLTRRKGADLLPLIARQLDANIDILYTSGLRTKNWMPTAPDLYSIGPIPYCDMPDIYRQADILLFPTVREGFGLAAAEAMACGLPVVATDCSSLPELVVHGKGGYLCEPGNVDEFAAKLNELAASSGLRKQMGEFNRARVEEKFTIDRMVSEYKQLFEEILASRSGSVST